MPARRRGDRRRLAGGPRGRRAVVRRRRRRAGDRRLLPHRPLVGGVRQLRRTRRRRGERRRSPSPGSPGATGATASPGRPPAGSPTSTAPCSAPGRRRRRTPAVDPVELPPGRYEVVLEPTAVADVLDWLCELGFNAKAVAERRSFVRLGDAQFDPAVRLVDDAPAAGWPYDADGTPRRQLVLVDAGTSVALTHDRRTAAAAGADVDRPRHRRRRRWVPRRCSSTLEPVEPDATAAEVDGPIVDCCRRRARRRRRARACSSPTSGTPACSTRARWRSPGLTRNGVWLIEDGEVTTPLRNFRFTQSYAQALMPGAVQEDRPGGVGDPRRQLRRHQPPLDGPRAAPGVLELHRRRQRLSPSECLTPSECRVRDRCAPHTRMAANTRMGRVSGARRARRRRGAVMRATATRPGSPRRAPGG